MIVLHKLKLVGHHTVRAKLNKNIFSVHNFNAFHVKTPNINLCKEPVLTPGIYHLLLIRVISFITRCTNFDSALRSTLQIIMSVK